jgi:hypothetical protein
LQERDPDFEEAENKATEVKYTDWTDFRRHVLEPSIKEINSGTDIFVSYDTVGRKVSTVIFTVELIQPDEDILKKQSKMSEEEANEMTANLMIELSKAAINLTFKETLQLVNLAEGDANLLKRNIDLLIKNVENGVEIDSYYGWLSSAIKQDYARSGNEQTEFVMNTFDEQLNEYVPNVVEENDVEKSDIEKANMIMEACFDQDILLSPGEEDEILDFCQQRDIEINLIIDAIGEIPSGSDIKDKNVLVKHILSYAATHKAGTDDEVEEFELDPEHLRTLAAKCKRIFISLTGGAVRLKYGECVLIINDIVAQNPKCDFDSEFGRLAQDINSYLQSGHNVRDYIAFIRSDIRQPYVDRGVKGIKKQASNNSFNNFSQRDFDYDAFEAQIIQKKPKK